jgi:hypothetical protein
VISAALMCNQAQPAPRIPVTRAGTAQVNQRCEILFLPQRRSLDARIGERLGDLAVEIRGRQLDGMRGDDACIQAIEPTRVKVVPRAVLDDDMIVDAVVPRLRERTVVSWYMPTALDAGR